MTEQIKSAIHCMQTSQDIEVCEECPIYGKVGTDHCFEDSCRIAEKSLQAWEEVLTELEETKEHATDLVRPKIFGMKLKEFTDMCFDEAINIIKQKLAEIAE